MHDFQPADGLHIVLDWADSERPFITTRTHTYRNTITDVTVPCGFRTDFASVPWAFRRVFPKVGRYSRAALFHDALYRSASVTRTQADSVFMAIMKHDGVPCITRTLLYLAVRLGGAAAWKKIHGRPSRRTSLSVQRQRRRDLGLFVVVVLAAVLGLVAIASGQCPGGVCPYPSPYQTPWIRPSTPAVQGRVITPPEWACRISVQDGRGGRGWGSGSLVGEVAGRGYVLTCGHLFDQGAAAITVYFAGRQKHVARRIADDRRNDLSLLVIESTGRQPVTVDSSSRISTTVTGAGFGARGRYRVVRGAALGYATPAGATAKSLKFRGSVRPGDSGGPLLNDSGRLIGVVWGEGAGNSYAVVGAAVQAVLQRVPPNQPAPGMQLVNPNRPAAGGQVVVQAPISVRGPPCDCGPKWKALDERLGRFEKRFDSLSDQVAGVAQGSQIPSDLIRQSDLDRAISQRVPPLVSQWNQQSQVATKTDVESLVSQVRDWVSRQFDEMPSQGGLIGLGSALGIGSPIGAALLASAWLKRRWSRRRARHQPPPAPNPPAPTTPPQAADKHAPPNRYVPYETDDFAEAHRWAAAQCAQKYPGGVEILRTLDSLIEQKLRGESD